MATAIARDDGVFDVSRMPLFALECTGAPIVLRIPDRSSGVYVDRFGA